MISPRLAAIILTLNEAAHIEECIATLRWADQILVFDSFSTDQTAALAESAGAQVIQHGFVNYGAQRDAALQAVDTDWVLFVDADERVTPALAAEISSKLDQPERGWWVPRHNYLFGKLTLGAGWFPDYQLRLMHRASAHYDPTRAVHEEVILAGPSGHLENPLIHYNYRDVAHFIAKQERYAAIEASIRHLQGLRPKPWTYLTAPLRQFWWRFATLRGYRDGFHGLRLSLLMAYYEFQTWRHVNQLASQ